jgi:5-dehydro-2-deoxygluconokinase
MNPTFCKVLVRYNPGGDATGNARQAARLRQLSEYLRGHNRLFMFELLVPALPSQLAEVDSDQHAYDLELRPGLMVQAIEQLQDTGVEPDLWKIEGLDRRTDCEKVVAAARRAGRSDVGCIILGRGEGEGKVAEWLRTAAGVPGFIGFAVGRTSFWDALVGWRDARLTGEQAAAQISERYREWVSIFANAQHGVAGGTQPAGAATRR